MIAVPPAKDITLEELNRVINEINRRLQDLHKKADKKVEKDK